MIDNFLKVLQPNGLRFRRLAGCAGLGQFYLNRRRSAHHRKPKAEGQVACKRGLGSLFLRNNIIRFDIYFINSLFLYSRSEVIG
jgi:hypothetical protein